MAGHATPPTPAAPPDLMQYAGRTADLANMQQGMHTYLAVSPLPEVETMLPKGALHQHAATCAHHAHLANHEQHRKEDYRDGVERRTCALHMP